MISLRLYTGNLFYHGYKIQNKNEVSLEPGQSGYSEQLGLNIDDEQKEHVGK